MLSFIYQIKYVIFLIKLLCIFYPFCVFSLPNYVEGRGIPLSMMPPGIRELAKEHAEYIIRGMPKIRETIEDIDKISFFIKKYPVILSYMRGEKKDERHLDYLDMLPCSVDEKVPEKLFPLILEYKCLVKKLHNQVVSSIHLKYFEEAFDKVENEHNSSLEKIYERVILRYPEYKGFDKKSVILFGVLLLTKRYHNQ